MVIELLNAGNGARFIVSRPSRRGRLSVNDLVRCLGVRKQWRRIVGFSVF
jgi:hypothetical protein